MIRTPEDRRSLDPHQSRGHRLARIARSLSQIDAQAERCHQWLEALNRRRADLVDDRTRLLTRGGAR